MATIYFKFIICIHLCSVTKKQHSTLNTNIPLLLINYEVIETACMIIL